MLTAKPLHAAFDLAPWARPRLHFAALLTEAGGAPVDLVTGQALTPEVTPIWGGSHLGPGVDFSASAATSAWILRRALPAANWTNEVLLVTGASVPSNIGLLTYAGSSIYETDRQLYVRGGVAGSYAYTGYSISAEGGAVTAANTAFHLGCTNDAANLTTYLNGAQAAQTAVTNTGYTGYAQPTIRLGYAALRGGTLADGSGTMVLALIWANALSPAEIAARAANPWAVLVPRILPRKAGSAAAGGTVYNEPSSGGVAAAEAVAVVATCAVSSSGAVTGAETVVAAASCVVASSGGVTGADSAAAVAVWGPSASDSVTGADTVACVVTFPPASTDSATGGEAVAALATANASASGSVTAADSAGTAHTMGAAASDALTGGEAVAAVATFVVSASDAGTVGDGAGTGGVTSDPVSGVVTGADAVTVAVTFVVSASGAGSAGDAAGTGGVTGDTVSDVVTAGGSVAATLVASVLLSVPAAVNDDAETDGEAPLDPTANVVRLGARARAAALSVRRRTVVLPSRRRAA